jgi:thiol-disulfide isomerase/thioredoxin
MRRIYLLSLFLLIPMVSIIGCGTEDRNEVADRLDENGEYISENIDGRTKAPAFTLQDTEGRNVSLDDYKGKIVILDFWATWCPPCRKGIPDLVELQNEYGKDLVVIGISLDQQTKPDVVPFIKEYRINYPVVYGDMNVVQAYGNIRSIPTSFVLDKDGNIVDMHVGLVHKSVYTNLIKKLLDPS